MSVHDESIPRSAQHSTKLGHGKRIGVLTDCGDQQDVEKYKLWGNVENR